MVSPWHFNCFFVFVIFEIRDVVEKEDLPSANDADVHFDD